MADYQRGVYEPTDEVHVFDGSEDDEDSEGSRLPLLIVIALFVLASFGGIVWLAYEKGVASGRSEPRTILADTGPIKVAPDNSGTTETPYKGLKIYQQPAPNEGYDGTTVESAAPPSSPPERSAAPATAAPPLRAPASEAAPHKSAATAPKSEGVTNPVTTAAPTEPGNSSEASLPASSAVSAPPESAIGQGTYLLQIGSYKSQAEADASWSSFQAKHSALIGGVSSHVKMADLGGKGVWYRLRVGPFADKDAANAMCERIKADGGNCFLAK